MLDHWGRLAIGIAPLEFCWVFLSFLSFSDEFSWYSRCSNFKYQLKNVLDPRPIPCWTTEVDLQSVLHRLSFLEFSEFSEISEYHKHYFGLIRNYFWLDSVSIVHDHPIPHRHALELRTTDFSDFPPWVFWVFLVLGLVGHRQFSKSVSWAMVDSYLSWYS